MPEIIGMEKLASLLARKRLGRHREYGRGMFAFSVYGEEDEFISTSGGGQIQTTGIYKKQFLGDRKLNYRLPYYIPYNPRTGPQQTNRQGLADGVAAWQLLTDEQKAVYNKRTLGRGMSGYNLFLKEYLLSI